MSGLERAPRTFRGESYCARAVARRVRAVAGAVIGEPRADVGRETDINVSRRPGTLVNVDESFVFRHPENDRNAVAERPISRNLAKAARLPLR